MVIAAFFYRLPAAGWKPAGWEPPSDDIEQASMITRHDVDIDQALKTPQFYQLWIVLCFNVTAGIGVLAVAKTMMTEIFGTTLPGTVDLEFAATYVLMISLFNMIGRFIWASASDYMGRKNTYYIFFGLGIVALLFDPLFCAAGERRPGRGLADWVLCSNHDHLHNVRRWLCDDPGLPRGYLRHPLRRRYPRSIADSLEHCGRVGPAGDHDPARECSDPSAQ